MTKAKNPTKPARDPLDHDGDGRKGGSVPKAQPDTEAALIAAVEALIEAGAEHAKATRAVMFKGDGYRIQFAGPALQSFTVN